jgi:hypothetical protein
MSVHFTEDNQGRRSADPGQPSVPPQQVAQWLYDQLMKKGVLEACEVAEDILDRFGEQYIYINRRGQLRIDSSILARFRELRAGRAVWDQTARAWRRLPPVNGNDPR